MITILDGPLGTELDARGIACDQDSWSARANESAPQVIADIHRDYARAGASIHTANTFRTKRRNVADDWRRLAVQAVTIAKANVPATHRVAGSIAPLEDCYRPERSPGETGRGEHRELAETLAAAEVDLLLCETFANVAELMIAIEESVRTGIETWAALTAGPDARLMTPDEMADGARLAVDSGAAAVLVNCTPTQDTLPFVRALAAAKLDVPIGAYANSGRDDWQSSSTSAVTTYEAAARCWIDAGATLIGGCCGTTPAHIARLHAVWK